MGPLLQGLMIFQVIPITERKILGIRPIKQQAALKAYYSPVKLEYHETNKDLFMRKANEGSVHQV